MNLLDFELVYRENQLPNPITKILTEQILLNLIFDIGHGRPSENAFINALYHEAKPFNRLKLT